MFEKLMSCGQSFQPLNFYAPCKPLILKSHLDFFGKDFSIPRKNFSELLGFHAQCVVDVDTAIQDFDRTKFWREISKELTCYCPHTNEIHHPTLRFMHKWLGFSLFPRNDFHTVRIDELKLLYAIVKRRKVSPIKFMMK